MEVIGRDKKSGPLVIVEEVSGKKIVHATSSEAEHLGIVAGMSLNAAYVICSNLQAQDIDQLAQQQRLEQLAKWALQYSPRISLHPPRSFLLEVRASIQYFGSLDIIQKQISEALEFKWQHAYHLSVSPTPAASILLAITGKDLVIDDVTELRSVLGSLPIALLPTDKRRKKQLSKIGVRVLRDLWRLPPAALTSRFGIDFTDYLDRCLGRLPDPQSNYQVPPRFEDLHDLGHEVSDYQLLLPCAYKLLMNLCDFLQGHDNYASKLIFYFQHEQYVPTVVNIDSRQTLRSPEYFMMLLETKISLVTLGAPVVCIKLVVETLHAYSAKTPDLFPAHDFILNSEQSIEGLLDNLYARLGYDVINYILSHADHRPEHAHRNSNLEVRKHAQITKPRPFWLLPDPKKLLRKNNQLHYKSVIRFCMGPERIEAGWWDGSDVHRDYYIGIDEIAGSLWIYHDLKDKQNWYVHGLFG